MAAPVSYSYWALAHVVFAYEPSDEAIKEDMEAVKEGLFRLSVTAAHKYCSKLFVQYFGTSNMVRVVAEIHGGHFDFKPEQWRNVVVTRPDILAKMDRIAGDTDSKLVELIKSFAACYANLSDKQLDMRLEHRFPTVPKRHDMPKLF